MTLECDFYARLPAITDEMRRAGFRRPLVLSGTRQWCSEKVLSLRAALAGDWLWLGESALWDNACPSQKVKTLLGREFSHAVFDARQGFDAAGLAALCGTLKAGSWLVILAPEWAQWPDAIDQDTLRWSDSPHAIASPNFIRHVQRCLRDERLSIVWRQGEIAPISLLINAPDWQEADGAPLVEQQKILEQLTGMTRGIAVVTAARGRGKSALAGMLTQRVSGYCLVTAPGKASIEVLRRYGRQDMRFIAPDQLIASPPSDVPAWLIIDEAAAIPMAMLVQMVALFPRVLLTTTVQGYEGTGRGFLLKLCAGLPEVSYFTLNTAIRWANGDPLEHLIDRMMLFEEADITPLPSLNTDIQTLSQKCWLSEPHQLMAIYRLLCSAHYKTSPLDWRRMLDAPGQRWLAAFVKDSCKGALWLNDEGGLTRRLSYQVWAGIRRPRGNLVAQSLAARGYDPQAAMLRGLRISRIAVHPSQQRQGTGLALVAHARNQAQEAYDYLSVSFGFTPSLWAFWRQAGFCLVHLGSAKEASSGCYNAIAILALSTAGKRLAQRLHRFFRANFVLHPSSWQQAFPDLICLLTPQAGLGGVEAQSVLPGDISWQYPSVDHAFNAGVYPGKLRIFPGEKVTGSLRLKAPEPWTPHHMAGEAGGISARRGSRLPLTGQERFELAGFAYAHRSLEASLSVLHRALVLCAPGTLPLLEQQIIRNRQGEDEVTTLAPRGRKMQLKALRDEAAVALHALAAPQAARLAAFMRGLVDGA